ncbi:MAG: thioredoxin domain-containing protein [Thermoplasmata archaeon]|nr:thioredoxin domain-containing protein [Thermoplasmata archaeon]
MAPSAEPTAHRLKTARSAYLRSAAEQKIDWYPWGPEPFELARRRHVPVLVDLGAAWCHWCHVMDEGTYTDDEVSRLLAQHFVAVKVDRDENPEIDRQYQRSIQALVGEGGWPLTVFATPEGEAFFGGTYFPAKDGMGRPGFRKVLKEIARMWSDEPEKIQQNTQALRDAFARMNSAPPTAPLEGHFLETVRREMLGSVDPVHGGFGAAPKFPHPSALAFLLADAFQQGDPAVAEPVRETLVHMADGGIYDQLGGGFHRYSVDEGWHIPHFEKMAVDNAALLPVFVDAARRFGDPRFEEVIDGSVAWAVGTLGDPAGGFGASQDADATPGDDGDYFTWTKEELKGTLPAEEYRLALRFFGIGGEGMMPHAPTRNVLYRPLPLTEVAHALAITESDSSALLTKAVQTLRTTRSRRPMPAVDHALYANLNGAYVGALARAASYRDDARWLALARKTADRFLDHAYDPARGVAHQLTGTTGTGYGMLDDQVSFAYGLTELGAATAVPRYAQVAAELLTLVRQEFSGDHGLFVDISPRLYDGARIGSVAAATVTADDAPNLSPNSSAVLAMARLGAITGDPTWDEAARALLPALRGRLRHAGLFAGGAALATQMLSAPAARVVVEGAGPEAAQLLRTARRTYHPNLVVFAGHPAPPYDLPIPGGAAAPNEARALVCFGTRCLPPVTTTDELAKILAAPAAPPP